MHYVCEKHVQNACPTNQSKEHNASQPLKEIDAAVCKEQT